MKVNIEDFLQKIDLSFKEKSEKDVYMIYIMIFGAIFAFSYLLFWDTSEAEFNSIKKKVAKVKSDIQTDEQYLQLNPQSKIAKIENDIKIANKQITNYKENNKYIKMKIEEISSLVYDEPTWGEYLHSISKHAKSNDIKLLEFSNKLTETKSSSFGHVLDINVNSTGSFKNTLNFINLIEQSDLVVDLHSFSIKAEKALNSDLNISVWGISY